MILLRVFSVPVAGELEQLRELFHKVRYTRARIRKPHLNLGVQQWSLVDQGAGGAW